MDLISTPHLASLKMEHPLEFQSLGGENNGPMMFGNSRLNGSSSASSPPPIDIQGASQQQSGQNSSMKDSTMQSPMRQSLTSVAPFMFEEKMSNEESGKGRGGVVVRIPKQHPESSFLGNDPDSSNSTIGGNNSNGSMMSNLNRMQALTPSSTNVVPAGSRRVPCKARSVAEDHNPKTAYIDIPNNAGHGLILTCSHPVCSESGRRFRYCAYCEIPVAKRNFRKRHSHNSDDEGGNNSMLPSGASGGVDSDEGETINNSNSFDSLSLQSPANRRQLQRNLMSSSSSSNLSSSFRQQRQQPQEHPASWSGVKPSLRLPKGALGGSCTFIRRPAHQLERQRSEGILFENRQNRAHLRSQSTLVSSQWKPSSHGHLGLKVSHKTLTQKERDWLSLLHNRPSTDESHLMHVWMNDILHTSEPLNIGGASGSGTTGGAGTGVGSNDRFNTSSDFQNQTRTMQSPGQSLLGTRPQQEHNGMPNFSSQQQNMNPNTSSSTSQLSFQENSTTNNSDNNNNNNNSHNMLSSEDVLRAIDDMDDDNTDNITPQKDGGNNDADVEIDVNDDNPAATGDGEDGDLGDIKPKIKVDDNWDDEVDNVDNDDLFVPMFDTTPLSNPSTQKIKKETEDSSPEENGANGDGGSD